MVGWHYVLFTNCCILMYQNKSPHIVLLWFFSYARARDLLVLLVELEVDVDELGEKATLRIMDYSYWYFLEKNI